MKRLLALVVVPVAVMVLSSCSTAAHEESGVAGGSASSDVHGDMHSGMASDRESSSVGAQGADMQDIMFAQMMIPHHQQAVEMATLAQTRASSPFIKDLANRIAAAQAPEIAMMQAWLVSWGQSTLDESDHMVHSMQGMVSDEQMAELASASGDDFDRLFATYMIAHHEGAILMATMIADSDIPEVAALSQAITTSQSAEIAEMTEFLAQLR